MSNNPLQQFFRQPKIYISLPSKGLYNKPGDIQGDIKNLAVYGMTGMDEILMKTPDALFSGESTVKVIQSCIPEIKNAWNLSNLDLDLVLTAIRIATYGTSMDISSDCSACGEHNEFSLALTQIVDHYSTCQFQNTIVLKDFVVKIRPLNYRELTDFSLTNARLQRQIASASAIEDEDERKTAIDGLYKEMAQMQYDIIRAGIESIELGSTVVNERSYIDEWLDNCDKLIIDTIKEQYAKNRQIWELPPHPTVCEACGHESSISIELDQASFFANA